MKKVIIINGSPRKNFNTAKLLKEAQKGAELSGAETEYFNLYDIDLFDEKHKAKVRDEQFPIDLENAFEMGKRLLEVKV